MKKDWDLERVMISTWFDERKWEKEIKKVSTTRAQSWKLNSSFAVYKNV